MRWNPSQERIRVLTPQRNRIVGTFGGLAGDTLLLLLLLLPDTEGLPE